VCVCALATIVALCKGIVDVVAIQLVAAVYSGVTVLLQWGYSGVAVVSPWCCKCVTVELQWCYSSVTVVLQWCYNGVKVVLKWCYRGVTEVLQRCYSGSGVEVVLLYPQRTDCVRCGARGGAHALWSHLGVSVRVCVCA
jgi:hypothetical protein